MVNDVRLSELVAASEDEIKGGDSGDASRAISLMRNEESDLDQRTKRTTGLGGFTPYWDKHPKDKQRARKTPYLYHREWAASPVARR
jgi:hypothetical protein